MRGRGEMEWEEEICNIVSRLVTLPALQVGTGGLNPCPCDYLCSIEYATSQLPTAHIYYPSQYYLLSNVCVLTRFTKWEQPQGNQARLLHIPALRTPSLCTHQYTQLPLPGGARFIVFLPESQLHPSSCIVPIRHRTLYKPLSYLRQSYSSGRDRNRNIFFWMLSSYLEEKRHIVLHWLTIFQATRPVVKWKICTGLKTCFKRELFCFCPWMGSAIYYSYS